MLPPRSLVVARTSAGAFALVAGLSLVNGTTEWTAAFRGLGAAVVIVYITPFFYNAFERALTPEPEAPANVNLQSANGKANKTNAVVNKSAVKNS